MVNSRTSEREQTPPPTGWLISDQGLNTPTLPISPPGRKTRANPSITPRKFRRFFTPRTQESTSATPKLDLSTSRQALHEITGQPKRKRTQPSPLRNDSIKTTKQEDSTTITPDSKRGVKRRKLDSSPAPHIKEYGLKVSGWDSPSGQWPNVPSSPCERAAEAGLEEVKIKEVRKPPKPIKQLPEYGLSARLLRMNIGSCTKSTRQYDAYPTNDWQNETAGFYSRPEDIHVMNGIEGNNRVIPFCTASCNTNSLTAIADEEGRVRLLETGKGLDPPFGQIFLRFQVHTNAIIDMEFSKDDMLLATASGDQTARVVDMTTQTTLSILGNHSASLKQVRFQPGANCKSVLATSSRDGSVQIWDLRCKGTDGPVQDFRANEPDSPVTDASRPKPKWARAVNSIWDAHKYPGFTSSSLLDTPSRFETNLSRTGDSITAITFLGQENLLATASQSDASIRLWDLRSLYNQRKTQIPLSQTAQPQNHTKFRNFGINSLNLSGDGSRLYSLCKDNTVYAYSTAHLMLGHAPELSQTKSLGRRLPPQESKMGLGPLYGFRHPSLHATTFYVKSAIRKAKDGRSELLAVGSSDGCAVLFPTDERYFPKFQEHTPTPTIQEYTQPPLYGPRVSGQRRQGSGLKVKNEALPISKNGSALIRGHCREVGSLSWTSEGELVTVGDDFIARVWREGDGAGQLRAGGETEGRRWFCGWAEASEGYDEDDG